MHLILACKLLYIVIELLRFQFHPATYFLPVLCRNTETLGFTKIEPYLITMIQLNMNNNNNNKITKQDHDHGKGSKLTCFCIDKLVSSSELLCSVDFCHYEAMLEEKNIIKAFQIHPFLARDKE